MTNEEQLQPFTDLYTAFHDNVINLIRSIPYEDRVKLGQVAIEIQEARNDYPWRTWDMANKLREDMMFWHEICYYPRHKKATD